MIPIAIGTVGVNPTEKIIKEIKVIPITIGTVGIKPLLKKSLKRLR